MQILSSRDPTIFNCLYCPSASWFLVCSVWGDRPGWSRQLRSILSFLFSSAELQSFLPPSLCQFVDGEFLPCPTKLRLLKVGECKTNLILPVQQKVLLKQKCYRRTTFLRLVHQVSQLSLVLWVRRLSNPTTHRWFDLSAGTDCWNFDISVSQFKPSSVRGIKEFGFVIW